MKAKHVAVMLVLGTVAALAVYNRTWLIQRTIKPAERLRQARERGLPTFKQRLVQARLTYPVQEVYLRAFKSDRVLELWATNHARGALTLVASYPIAAMSGGLGPKRKEGDRQVPEGFYEINRFNPASGFWLSLGLNYPNASDQILSDPKRPGGDIFIHGSNKSIGCLAMTDALIEEIYPACLDARAQGQKVIRVDIFPSRAPLELRTTDTQVRALWKVLADALAQFERTHRPVQFKVLSDGRMALAGVR